MACNAPLTVWKSKTGKGITFDIHAAYVDIPMAIPCGNCMGCKLQRSREWAIRCTHETQMHEENTFITLTYNKKNLPVENGLPTLRPRDFVLFMKKLRKRRDTKIRFFQSGQYGILGRPHHHALLFGCGFRDSTLWRRSGDFNIYRSEELEELWTQGHSEIGTATFKSAGYIARYTMRETEQLRGRKAEYLTMSRKPGIGSTWLEKYISDVYPSDQVITPSGFPIKPPRYYDEKLRDQDQAQGQDLWARVRERRQANLTPEQRSGDRAAAREIIQKQKSQQRGREL